MILSILIKNKVLLLLILLISILIGLLLLNCDFFTLNDFKNSRNLQESIFQRNVETITFEASYGSEKTLPQYYSFDSQERISSDFQKNDIFFSVSGNTDVFLVFKPMTMAQSIYVENNDTSGVMIFNYEDCESNGYSGGSRPIPKLNSKFCLKTNDGNLVEFIVTNISQIIDDQTTYQVTIKYILWDV